MKAVIKQRRGDGFVELADAPEPNLSPGHLLVRVGAAGICGSDLMILHDLFPSYNVPVILGHEFAGFVEDVWDKASGFSRGDRVVCETHAFVCEQCDYCRSGKYNLCPERKGFGYGVDGAFTRLVSAREPIIHKLPDNLSIDEAAVLEPASVATNALIFNSRINPGDSVLIFGPGPIGLLCLQLAKLAGAQVTMVGTARSRPRLDLASKEFSADNALLDTELEQAEMWNKFDVAIIAAGSPGSFEPALKAVRKLGRVVHIGESTAQATFQLSLIERKNLTVQGSFSHNWPVWEKAISLACQGKIRLSPLITHKVILSDWKSGFDFAESGKAAKVIINP